jgi:hypothetical protein
VITGSTKISRVEEAALESAYGTVHRGLRVALDQLFVGGSVLVDVGGRREDVPECRIHPAWEEKARWFDQGVELVRKACTVCGHESVDRAK